MDSVRFDDLSRTVARGFPRRAALRGAAAGLLAALGLRRVIDAQVTQAQCGNRTCNTDPGVCNDGCVCCDYGNGNSRCRPPGACGPGVPTCPAGEVVGPSGGCIVADCATGADCPLPPNLCLAAVCVDGACGFAPSFSECNEVNCAPGAACLFTAGGEPVCARWDLPCEVSACASDAQCGPDGVCLDLASSNGLCCDVPSTGCGVIATDVFPPRVP